MLASLLPREIRVLSELPEEIEERFPAPEDTADSLRVLPTRPPLTVPEDEDPPEELEPLSEEALPL